MKRSIYWLPAALLTLVQWSSASAQTTTISNAIITPLVAPCSVSGVAGSIKVLGRSTVFTAHRDFSGGIENGVPYPPGTFGAEPLFRTSFVAGGTAPSCVMVTLSVNAQPNDNGMVFQARVDGVPMSGHWNPVNMLNLPAGFNVPIVWLPNVVDQPGMFEGLDPPHLASYTFFANVKPGLHLVEVRVAGCCHEDINLPASAPDGYVQSATLAIQHR